MVEYLINKNTEKQRQQSSSGHAEDGEAIWLMTIEEFASLEGDYPYKKNFIRSMEAVRYCKVEMYHNCIQGTMKIPEKGRKKNKGLIFGYYMKDRRLIFVEEGNSLKNIITKIKKDAPKELSLPQFLFLVFDFFIENDAPYLQTLEESMENMEEEVLKKMPDHFYETILFYRKRLTGLHAYYDQLMNIGEVMEANRNKKLTETDCMDWKHFTNRAKHLHDYEETLREYLLQIRELYQSQIEVRQNKTMSFLTVITTLFLPLSLIAGWYGMNFPNMPEFGWKYAYPAVIVLVALIITGEILYFKKKKML